MVIVYYVEGDGGHLLNEKMGHPGFRTAVRGSCQSYSMPWEEIMEDLMRFNNSALQTFLLSDLACEKGFDNNTNHSRLLNETVGRHILKISAPNIFKSIPTQVSLLF